LRRDSCFEDLKFDREGVFSEKSSSVRPARMFLFMVTVMFSLMLVSPEMSMCFLTFPGD
jgi:hypothetical protein